MKICINSCPAAAYAESELKCFLLKYTNVNLCIDSATADKSITLTVDSSIPSHHYSIHNHETAMEICGGNASSVLCGVCEALADAGILFEANGYSVPHGFDLNHFFSINKDVYPKFRQRGIRQHINFTMDISSYPLWEAQEYIRNLARMRYNAITFHSYPGQWHKPDPADPNSFEGHFFYGQKHPVPTDDPVTARRIHNKAYYCIPETEALYMDEKANGEYAVYWLNQVMQSAKDAGMTITLSVEIRSDDQECNTRMLHNLCIQYPLIDTLELITEECGGFRDIPGLTREQTPAYLTELFGDWILDENGNVPGLPDFLPHQLGAAAVSLQRLLKALENREAWLTGLSKIPELRAGLYMTCVDTLRVLRPILRHQLPSGMTMSLLPAHGALAAANNIENTGTIPEDWQNTMFYSWAEFDGNMFIQQMSTDGIEKLVSMPDTDSSYGFCINHWRTAENTLTISYAAEAAISAMPSDRFARTYAEKIGIENTELFTKVCGKLAWLDTYNRDNLFNIGFCVVVCWLNWCRKGDMILTRGFNHETLMSSIKAYEAIIQDLETLLPSAGTPEAIAYIRLMHNRCQTSILHIRSLMVLEELREVYDYENLSPVTDEQKEKIDEILNRSRCYAMEYLHLYGENLPDRGGEGQLVSYHETTLAYIDAIKASFHTGSEKTQDDVYDAPPLPDEEAK